jgi:hypothetical protein
VEKDTYLSILIFFMFIIQSGSPMFFSLFRLNWWYTTIVV